MRALLFSGALLLAGVARGDGGMLRSSQSAGSFVISIFTGPEPLRAGPAEVSVLVQSGGTVVLDAQVELRLRGPDGGEQTLATSRANNQLLQSAFVELRPQGRFELEVTARRAGASATVSCKLDVGPAPTGPRAHWAPLALPALCILLFFVRERWLVRPRI
jgi:hypothetical protein